MPRLKYYNEATEQWEYVVVGAQGPVGPQGDTGPAGADGTIGVDGEQGPAGIIAQTEAPTDTSVIWVDTDASAIDIPIGGTAGQALTKVDGTDFNTEWSDIYSQSETDTAISNAIAGLVDTAPTALNTLNELAAAINDDASFASTITTALGNKSDTGHTHDDRYYTETEADSLLNAKANLSGAAFTGDISAKNLKSNRADSVQEGGQLELAKATDNTTAWTIDSFGGTSTPDFRVFDSGGTVRLAIDGGGRVLKPSQPSFLAVKSDNGNTYSGDYVFNTAMNNTGGHYSTSTGRFTAPAAGRYYFVTQIQTYGISAGVNSSVAFKKNNAIFADSSGGTPKAIVNKAVDITYHNTITLALVMDLAANDYVSVYTENSRGMQSHFSGYLIG